MHWGSWPLLAAALWVGRWGAGWVGVEVEVQRLVAVHDQHQHNEPFAFFSVERFFFLCRLKGGEFQDNIETLSSGWFSLDDLPYLHPQKSSETELRLCLEASKAEHWETDYDL